MMDKPIKFIQLAVPILNKRETQARNKGEVSLASSRTFISYVAGMRAAFWHAPMDGAQDSVCSYTRVKPIHQSFITAKFHTGLLVVIILLGRPA